MIKPVQYIETQSQRSIHFAPIVMEEFPNNTINSPTIHISEISLRTVYRSRGDIIDNNTVVVKP